MHEKINTHTQTNNEKKKRVESGKAFGESCNFQCDVLSKYFPLILSPFRAFPETTKQWDYVTYAFGEGTNPRGRCLLLVGRKGPDNLHYIILYNMTSFRHDL